MTSLNGGKLVGLKDITDDFVEWFYAAAPALLAACEAALNLLKLSGASSAADALRAAIARARGEAVQP